MNRSLRIDPSLQQKTSIVVLLHLEVNAVSMQIVRASSGQWANALQAPNPVAPHRWEMCDTMSSMGYDPD